MAQLARAEEQEELAWQALQAGVRIYSLLSHAHEVIQAQRWGIGNLGLGCAALDLSQDWLDTQLQIMGDFVDAQRYQFFLAAMHVHILRRATHWAPAAGAPRRLDIHGESIRISSLPCA